MISSIGILLVAALIAGIAIYFHAQHNTTHIATAAKGCQSVSSTSSTTGKAGIVGQVSPSTDQGITMQVVNTYADPLGTTILVAITGTPAQTQLLINDPTATFVDNSGKTITYTRSGGGYFPKDTNTVIGLFQYPAFTPQQLQGQIQVRFVIHSVTLMGLINGIVKPPAGSTQLSGTWENSYLLNPVAGTVYSCSIPAIAEQGVSFQIQSLEVAPSYTADHLFSGGIRIILTVSGLPVETQLRSFGWYSTQTIANPQLPVPASAILTLPGFTQQQDLNPIASILAPQIADGTTTVGESSIQLALMYNGTGTPNGSHGLISIINFQVLVSENGQLVVKTKLLPFTLQIVF